MGVLFITQKRKSHPKTTSLTTLIVIIACNLQAWYGNNKHEYDERLSKFMLWSYCCSFASLNLVMRVIIMRCERTLRLCPDMEQLDVFTGGPSFKFFLLLFLLFFFFFFFILYLYIYIYNSSSNSFQFYFNFIFSQFKK